MPVASTSWVQCHRRQPPGRTSVQQRETDLVAGNLDPPVSAPAANGRHQNWSGQFRRSGLPRAASSVRPEHPNTPATDTATNETCIRSTRRQIQTPQRGFDTCAHGVQRHLSGGRAPFGQDRWWRLPSFAQQLVGPSQPQIFGTAVVIGHIECIEPVAGIGRPALRQQHPDRRLSRPAPDRPSATSL